MVSEHSAAVFSPSALATVELALLAAHRDDHDEREAADLHHAEHVRQIADAARLHQQHRFSPPSHGAGARPMPSSSVVSTTRAHAAIGLAQLDQPLVAGVGHVADNRHAGGRELGDGSRRASQAACLSRVCPGAHARERYRLHRDTAVGTDARIGPTSRARWFGKVIRGNAHLASPRGQARCAMARLTLIKLCRFSQRASPG